MRLSIQVHCRSIGASAKNLARFLAFGLFFSVAVVGCGGEEPVIAAPPVRAVKILEVGTQGRVLTREYPGEISAAIEAEVTFEVGGRIIELPVVLGQFVREGTLLARLDPSDFEARLEASVAQRNAARADYDRFKELLDKDAVSERDFETRKRNWEVAEANLRIAQKDLDDTRLLAPFRGVVARKHVERFQNVQAQEHVLLLQDSTSLEIDVSLPEADVLRLGRGSVAREVTDQLKPEVTVSSIPGRTFPARLTEVATAADPATRTFKATFSFESSEENLILPGMTSALRMAANFEDTADGKDGFIVPATAAVIDESGRAFVWKVDPGTMVVRKVVVELGTLSGDSIEVRGGLEAGDLIATTGANQLREGMEVRRLESSS